MKKPHITPTSKERVMRDDDFIVSKTDTKGHITYGNEIFVEYSGYSWNELKGTPHNIIRHPDMPRVVFKLLWDTISTKKEIFAFVKNLSKDGGFYWVFTHVTPDLDINGNIIGYLSVRRKPSKIGVETMTAVYKEMIEIEKKDGMDGSFNYLVNILNSKGVSYDDLISLLQG